MWDGGRSGRILLDLICQQAIERLRPGGVLLAAHGAICGTAETEALFAAHGLTVSVPVRAVLPMTELLQLGAAELPELGPWGPEAGTCEMVIVRGQRSPVAAPA